MDNVSTVFLSWSGTRSGHVATALKTFLRSVFLDKITVWISKQDIDKGIKGADAIADGLGTDYCIPCLTTDNLTNPWINYEAGACAKNHHDAHIWTVLVGMQSTELPRDHPLAQWQYTETSKVDFLALTKSINTALVKPPIADDLLLTQFEAHWPALEASLANLPATSSSSSGPPAPPDTAKQTFDLVRELALQMDLRFADMRAYMVEDARRTQEYLKYISRGGEAPSDLSFTARRRIPLSAGGTGESPTRIDELISRIHTFRNRVSHSPDKISEGEYLTYLRWQEELRSFMPNSGSLSESEADSAELANAIARMKIFQGSQTRTTDDEAPEVDLPF